MADRLVEHKGVRERTIIGGIEIADYVWILHLEGRTRTRTHYRTRTRGHTHNARARTHCLAGAELHQTWGKWHLAETQMLWLDSDAGQELGCSPDKITQRLVVYLHDTHSTGRPHKTGRPVCG
jgi:hypothetical protein